MFGDRLDFKFIDIFLQELELLAVHKVVTEDFMIWKRKANERCEKDSLESELSA